MLQINSVLLSIAILSLAAAKLPTLPTEGLSTKDTEEWEIEPDPTAASTGESCDRGDH